MRRPLVGRLEGDHALDPVLDERRRDRDVGVGGPGQQPCHGGEGDGGEHDPHSRTLAAWWPAVRCLDWTRAREIDRKGMALLSGGHCATDFASGAVPALLPFLTEKFDLSYTLTAVVMLVVLVSSSVMQPLFGLWSDRRGALWLLPGGVAVAAIGVGLAAWSPSYGLVVAFVFVAESVLRPIHPEGAKLAIYISGHKRASGMSLFNIGGNTGYALGPIVVTAFVVWLGIGWGGLVASIPVLAVAGRTPPEPAVPGSPAAVRALGLARTAEASDDVRAMLLLAAVIGFRSVAWFGLITFMPLWVVSLGDSKAQGNHLFALMLLAGAVGTLVLGPVADRSGCAGRFSSRRRCLPRDRRLRLRRRASSAPPPWS